MKNRFFSHAAWKSLLLSIVISLGVGILSAIVSQNGMAGYASFRQPFLSPPAILFPIVWTILFVLMGISAYRIGRSDSPLRQKALWIYGIQLLVNFCWSPIFFNQRAFLFAFFWILLLWILILFMMLTFRKIDKTAAFLQIPYLVWVAFAGYLNFGVFLLNR